MAKVLKEYFGEVHAFDAYHYGYGPFELRLVCVGERRRLAYARGVGAAVSKSARRQLEGSETTDESRA